MTAESRAGSLKSCSELQGSGVERDAIGTSYLRLSLGSSDLDEYTFSYNQTPGDTEMAHFDLGYDRRYLIPVLKSILEINPDIRLMASPGLHRYG
jgi:glucosylceramidase